MRPLAALGLLAAFAAPCPAADPTAVAGRVTGKVQQVGFRAMILKQAIRFNLTGTAENNKDGTVSFVLQGDPDRVDAALKVIAKGTDKSADVAVKANGVKADPKLAAFTVVGWTSTSRMITTPYDLVFTPRKNDAVVSEKDAEKAYHAILEKTLGPDDLRKLNDKDGD